MKGSEGWETRSFQEATLCTSHRVMNQGNRGMDAPFGGMRGNPGDREPVLAGKVSDVSAAWQSNSSKTRIRRRDDGIHREPAVREIASTQYFVVAPDSPTGTPTYKSLRKAIMKCSVVLSSRLTLSGPGAFAQDALSKIVRNCNMKLNMKRRHQLARRPWLALATAAGAALLSGCGAGAGDDSVPGASNDPAAYATTLDYCGSVEPTGNSAQPGGWELTSPHHPGAPLYDVSALVSVGGARGPSSLAPSLLVDVHDYRAVIGSFLPAAYVEPEWKMGIAFFPVFAARAAACVVSLAKLMPTPGTTAPAPSPFSPSTYTLAWRSKWSTAVPVEQVPGKVVDGFEFVSNFVPQGAQAFFTVSKTRLASAQDVAICYLAPAGTQWDCTPATVADRVKDWQFSRAGAEAGVYVLSAR